MDYKDVIEKAFNDDFDKVNSYRYQDIINYLNTVMIVLLLKLILLVWMMY